MVRDDVIRQLKAIEPQIRAEGVAALYLYGSYARDEAREGSDLDILVEFAAGRGSGLPAYMAPYELLERQFPKIRIGHGTLEAIASPYRPSIESGAIRIF